MTTLASNAELGHDMWCAFLKGINVGGARKVAMAELRSALESAGFGEVRTYIQSGNVVFDHAEEPPEPASVATALESRFGFAVAVVVRSRSDMVRIARSHPLAGPDADPRHLHVVFLADDPGPGSVSELDPRRSPRDGFAVVGREVFVHYPDGAGRSKLTTDYIERVLGTVATARNWNTVNRMVEMMGPAG